MSASGPITVLHYVGGDDDRSGIVSVVRALASTGRFQCELGVNTEFFQQRTPPLRTVAFSALPPERIDLKTLWRARFVADEVRRWLVADRNRVFHGHSRAGLLIGLWLNRAGERRVVVSVHCYGRRRWFYRWAAGRFGDRFFWLSPAMKAYYGAGATTWDGCIPNGLPVTSPSLRNKVREPGQLVLGGVGMLVRWKQWHLVLEALVQLPREIRRRIIFRHIGVPDGTGESRSYARELATRTGTLGLSGQVSWLGWQPSANELLRDIDCLVVASKREPFSMAALEALFAGVPVIAADEAGPTDFVVEGRSGWFFRSGDPQALARVLEKLVITDALQQVRIDTEPLRRFSAEAVAAQWLAVYERLVQP